MKKIPADLDALMWTITEDNDMAAIDDFERRFPQFKGELATRIAMVRGLKQSRPAVRTVAPIPRFVPRDSGPPAANRRSVFAVAMLGGLAVVALGAYAVVANLPKPTPVLVPKNEVIHTQPEQDPNENAVGNMDREPGALNPTNPGTSTNPSVAMPWDKPQSVSITDAALIDVLKLIAETCGLRIELAPNMPNPVVSVRYTNRAGMDMLKDLGRQYKFTPLEQGQGEVLIVPAVEFTSP